jgi:hypothetical protein
LVVRQRNLTSPLPGSQNIQALPGSHGREPSGQVLHIPQVRMAGLNPRLLQHVVGVVE